MEADAGVRLSVLNVDGGASANDFLMQFQSDILRTPLRRPQNAETTALGAAFLAGLATGFWKDAEALCALRSSDDVYEPGMEDERHAKAAGRLGSRREAHDVGRPVILSGAPKERSSDAKPVL